MSSMKNSYSIKSLSLFITAVLSITMISRPVAANTTSTVNIYAFSLAPAPLNETLLQIARQSGKKISFDPAIVNQYNAGSIKGNLSAEQAVAVALQGTDLALVSTDAGIWSIQQQSISPVKGSADSAKNGLPPITVQAQREKQGYAADSVRASTRTETSVLELPRSVSAVPHELLEDQQTNNIADALRNVSGVTANVGGNGGISPVSINIRGFDVDNAMTDGMMSAGSMAFSTPMIAYDRIEVAKGPEAIAGGRAAKFGGVVNLISKTPQTQTSRELQSLVDSSGQVQTGVDMTGSLTDDKHLAGRLITSLARDGSTDRGWDGGKNYFLAPSLSWKGASDELLAGAELNNNKRPFGNYAYTFNDRVEGDLQTTPHAKDDSIQYQTRRYYADYHHYFDNDWEFNLRGQYATQDATGKNWLASGYANYPGLKALGIPSGDIFEALALKNHLNYSSTTLQTTLLKSVDIGPTKHDILTGYDYFKSKTDQSRGVYYDQQISKYFPANGSVILPSVDSLSNHMYLPSASSHSETVETGYFIQDQIAWDDRWNFLISARHVSFRPNNTSGDIEPVSKWLYGLGMVYRITPTISSYTSYSEGLTNSYSYPTIDGSTLPPVEAKQYEAGTKFAFLKERVVLTTALFEINQKNVPQVDPRDISYYYASKGIKSRGAEVELRGKITPELNVSMAYSNILAENESDGSTVNGRPRHHFNLWTTYEFMPKWTVGGGLDARSSADNTGVADYTTQSMRVLHIPGQTRLDAMLRYDTGNWSATLGIRNLTNKALYDTGSTGSYVYVEPERTYTLSASLKF